MRYFSESRAFSERRLDEIRGGIEAEFSSPPIVVACGSYARREASSESDLDYFAVGDEQPHDDEIASIGACLGKFVPKAPSAEGAFAESVKRSDLLANFGGSKDSNATITRRMLILLEGDYLTRGKDFEALRRAIIARYVDETPRDHQLAFYLLNDLIRYWRTLAVDYAQKTYGADTLKPWAVRNVKLIFSRKLIYAGGLFSVALTCDRTRNDKIEILSKLFTMNPIDRLRFVCGDGATQRLFEIYDNFLGEISDAQTRRHLDGLSREDKEHDPIFRRIKNEGHYFSREIYGLFGKTFQSSHPIHMAVVF